MEDIKIVEKDLDWVEEMLGGGARKEFESNEYNYLFELYGGRDEIQAIHSSREIDIEEALKDFEKEGKHLFGNGVILVKGK